MRPLLIEDINLWRKNKGWVYVTNQDNSLNERQHNIEIFMDELDFLFEEAELEEGESDVDDTQD